MDLRSSLTFASNGSLRCVAGLDNLTTASRPIAIRGNRSLISLDALDELRSVEKVDVRLIISSNASLASVDLEALGAVSGDLTISNNPRLDSFSGMSAMQEVGEDLTISGNAMLPRSTAEAFATSITVGGTTTIEQ